MCLPSRPRPRPTPRPPQSPQPNAKDSTPMMARVERTTPPAPTRNMQVKQDIVTDIVDLQRPAPTPPPTPPAPQEPEPKMRTIKRTVAPGTTVRGQQRTESAAPSRRRRRSTRVGRRFGTSSLRIARNPNTGTGNLNY